MARLDRHSRDHDHRRRVHLSRTRPRLIALICLTVGASTFPIGAFPALLPDLDRVVGLSDVQLGALAAAFGFSRMLVDIPVGLFVARHLPKALVLSPVLLTLGILAIGSGGPFVVLIGGRLLMGVAHALGMVAWLTTILRYLAGRSLGSALNAVEFTAMIGMLAGVGAVGVLPRDLPWNVVLLIACAPQAMGIVLGPLLVRELRRAEPPAAPATAAATAAATAPVSSAPRRAGPAVVLAFAAGATLAMTYATLELNVLPLRASREFALDRGGVARLLMLAQVADIAALLPLGFLADRVGATRVLPAVTATMAGAVLLATFGGFAAVNAGAAMLGLAMAGWMLPLTLLRRETPPEAIAWRTALYRVGVDGGLFLGPFVAGLAGPRVPILAVLQALALVAVSGALLARARAERGAPR